MRITAQFKRRWLELTGVRYSPSFDLPPTLVSSIATLRGGPVLVKAPGPAARRKASVVVKVRATQGKGCGKVAEIGGFYAKEFPVTAPVILGPAGVKAVLDAAARDLCCEALDCPPDKNCPCTYIPQPTLAAYELGATYENGYLLQEKRVWNCQCGKVEA